MGKIDEESLVLLDHLLDFVDKQAIMEVMVNRMMKAKHHKRAARTMIFPTLNIERDNTKVYKKMYCFAYSGTVQTQSRNSSAGSMRDLKKSITDSKQNI